MTFKPFDTASFPARKSTAPIDVDAANALVEMLNKNGAVSDGENYATENKARSAASKAKRLAAAATVKLANGKVLRTRVATPKGAKEGTFAFALSLADAPKASK
jgi:hypothetical protein